MGAKGTDRFDSYWASPKGGTGARPGFPLPRSNPPAAKKRGRPIYNIAPNTSPAMTEKAVVGADALIQAPMGGFLLAKPDPGGLHRLPADETA